MKGGRRTELWKDRMTNTISPSLSSKRWGTIMLPTKIAQMVLLDLEGSY